MADDNEALKKALTQACVRQIMHISQVGCRGIRCRGCVLNRICDHFPAHAQDYANQMITYANLQD